MRKRYYDEIVIVNNYIYLINNLLFNKEIIVSYYNNNITYSLWMGLSNPDIILPQETSKLLRTGLFKLDSSSINGTTHIDVYVLNDNETLKNILKVLSSSDKDILPESNSIHFGKYLSIDIEQFEPSIKILRRINNLDKLLYK
jgi:hypothetical protein